MFICPSLSWNPLRDTNGGGFYPADGYGPTSTTRTLFPRSAHGGFLVNSGTPGHLHVYVKLAEPQPADVIETFNRRLVRHLERRPVTLGAIGIPSAGRKPQPQDR